MICRYLAAGLSLLLALSTYDCAVTQPVRVLSPGEVRVTASIGGPVVPGTLPTVIVPYATAGAAVGVTDQVTATGNLHLVLAALKTAGIDGGAAFRLLREEGAVPEVTAKGQLMLMTDFTAGSFRAFPSLSVNGSYRLGESTLGYGGLESMFQFTGEDHVLAGPFVGVQFALSHRLAMQTELKWLAANVDTRHGIFEGESSLGGHGSLGFFLGASYVW